MPLFDTLFSKTFFILGSQLLVTCMGAKAALVFIRKLYHEGAPGVTESRSHHGDIDIHIGWEFVGPYLFGLLITDILLFVFLMFYGMANLKVGVPVFFAWYAFAGAQVALALITVDEDLGARLLALAALFTLLVALVEMYSGLGFSVAWKILLYGLTCTIIYGIARLFMSIQRVSQRVFAVLGVTVFTGYLLYDFHHLYRLGKVSSNDWHSAMTVSIGVYLDVVNQFFDLLDKLAK